jgi:ankyrin repeat protein
VDAVDAFGNTPLQRWITAPYPLDLAVLELLLGHGADPCRKNNLGQSPLDAARTIGHEKIIEHMETAANSSCHGSHCERMAPARTRATRR